MIDESLAAGASFIHRRDPRVRVALATLFSFVVALSDRFDTLAGAMAAALALTAAARLHPLKLARRLGPLWLFLILIWLALPFTTAGRAVFSVWGLNASAAGLALAGRISLKSVAILLAFTALVATLHMSTLGHSLHRLRVPEKIVHLLLLTYRYIFVIQQEYQRLARAARVRGFRPATSLHTYRSYAYMVGMLFIQAAGRGQRVHRAMRCRGFNGRFRSLHQFAADRADWALAVGATAVICYLAYLEWIRQHLLSL